MATLQSITIDDPLDSTGAVEVTVRLKNGEDRWCFFITPKSLESVGDWIPGTKIRHHIGERHMIVAAQLSEEFIELVLRDLDDQKLLERHTLPLDTPT